MRACGSYKWIPHIALQPAVKCPNKYHHTTFSDDRQVSGDEHAKPLTAPSLDGNGSPSPSPAPSTGPWCVLDILEHIKLSAHDDDPSDRSSSLSPIYLGLDLAGDKMNGPSSPQSMELAMNKEFSPSDSSRVATLRGFDPERKDSELFSFLFYGDDTDTDDDIFPPTTIALDGGYGSIGTTASTECSSIASSPNIKDSVAKNLGKAELQAVVPRRVHVPCRNLWELM